MTTRPFNERKLLTEAAKETVRKFSDPDVESRHITNYVEIANGKRVEILVRECTDDETARYRAWYKKAKAAGIV